MKLEKMLSADPEDICKQVLESNEKISQVEFFPTYLPDGRYGVEFIFRIDNERYGGTILCGLEEDSEMRKIHQLVLDASLTGLPKK